MAVSGFATGLRGDAERVPTTSDLAKQEILDIANTARQQLEIDDQALREERPTVERATAKARAKDRVEAMQERYWEALQGRRPGIGSDVLAIVERLPPPPRQVGPEQSR